MSSLLDAPVRHGHRRKRLGWSLLIVALVCVLLVVVGRKVLIRRMLLPRLTLSQPSYVLSVALTPDGKTVLAGGDALDYAAHKSHPVQRGIPADVFVWDVDSGRLLRRLQGLTVRSNAVSVSPDGQRVFATGSTAAVRGQHGWSHVLAWDIASGRQLWNVEGDMPLGVSPDGRMIANVGSILRTADRATVCRTTAAPAEDGQSEFTPDNRLLALIGGPHLNPKTVFRNNSDNGRSYYATTRLSFWHTDTGKLAFTLPFTRVRAFDFTPDGRELVITSETSSIPGGTDGSVLRRVRLATGKVLWERTRSMNGSSADPDAVINSLVVSPNGKYVVVQSMTSRLMVLDAHTGKELFRPFVWQQRGDPNWVLPGGVTFSADGRTLVSRRGNQVLVWDASSLL